MPRRRVAAKREVLPDPKFGSTLLAKFVNHVMESGKKSVAERIVYGALEIVKEKLSKDPIEIFEQAMENIAPMVEVKARRVGGATYQVPVEVDPRVSEAFAHRWLIEAARKRSGKTFADKLFNELLDAYHNKGRAVETKESTHKMAEANKAYAHFK